MSAVGRAAVPLGVVIGAGLLALACTEANPAYWGRAAADDAGAFEPGVPDGPPVIEEPAQPDAAAPPVDLAPPLDVASTLDQGGTDVRDLAGPAEAAPPPDSGAIAPDVGWIARTVSLLPGWTSPWYGGTGGDEFAESCRDPQVLIGLRISVRTEGTGNYIGGLQGLCGELVVNGSGPYTITVTARGVLTARGGGTLVDARCPTNQVMVGMLGRANARLDQLQVQCAALSVPTLPQVQVEPRNTLPARGGGGGNIFQAPCPTPQVARGLATRDGVFIDAISLVCAAPLVGP